jgi:FMN reductase
MMTLRISIVVGNPKPKSRTLKVAETLAEKLFGPASRNAEIIDLADYRDEILSWPSEKMDALNARVAASDVAIFASPTYKATYTGLLKVFLDRYPANGLAGVTAIPLLTGADQTHAMGPTVNLSPLLVELGAIVPGRGLYFVIGQMDRLDELVQAAADQYATALRRMAKVAAALPSAGKNAS